MRKIIVILGIITVVGLLILLPVFIYGGFTINTVEGTLTLESTTTELSKSMTVEAVGPSISSWSIDLQNKTQNAWKYAFSGIGGRNSVNENKSNVDVSLELSITFVIKKGNEIIKEINVGVLNGERQHEIYFILGPGEGFTVSGEYELLINIKLSLQAPGTDLSLNISLGPIKIYYEA